MTSNAAESLNNRLLWARRLPVCALLECVRSVIEEWFYKHQTMALACNHELTPACAAKLNKSIEASHGMEISAINNSMFNVKDGNKSYLVNLREHTCSCREFEGDLIPCPHAAKAIG